MNSNCNLFEYLDWRGDLPMSLIPPQEIDAMILSRFIYAPFHLTSLKDRDCFLPVEIVIRELLSIPNLSNFLLDPEDYALLEALLDSPRFQTLKIGNFVDILDPEKEFQFCACTIEITPALSCICFRGTDNTLIGWKENFNMGFHSTIPSQKLALTYFNEYTGTHQQNFILAGHSKGGNLAAYAASFCPPKTQDRITCVYNYDGPGFDQDVLSSAGYQRICHKIQTFVPQSSLVGILLGHREAHKVVHSRDSLAPLQHNLFSWEIYGTSFVYEDSLTNTSKYLDSTMKNWLSQMSQSQRENFVEGLFTILSNTDAQTLNELKQDFFNNSLLMIQAMRNLDKETKNALSEGLSLFMKSAWNTLGSWRDS